MLSARDICGVRNPGSGLRAHLCRAGISPRSFGMSFPDSRDGGTRLDRRTVLRTGLASAGTIAAGTLAGGTRAMAQETTDPASPSGTPPGGGAADDLTVGPDGVVFASETPPGPITIFVARKIVTMNPSNPEATHVAARDG